MIKKNFAASLLISLVCFFTGHVLVGVAVILLELLFKLFKMDDLIIDIILKKKVDVNDDDLILTSSLLGTILTYGYIVFESFTELYSWWSLLMITLYVILPVIWWYFRKD